MYLNLFTLFLNSKNIMTEKAKAYNNQKITSEENNNLKITFYNRIRYRLYDIPFQIPQKIKQITTNNKRFH